MWSFSRGGIAALSLIVILAAVQPAMAKDAHPLAAKPIPGGAQLCPNPETQNKERDPGHYKPQPGYTITDGCNTCADPHNKYTGTAANRGCRAYAQILACLGGGSCSDKDGTFKIYRASGYALLQLKAGGAPSCHYVTFALAPTIGVEDRRRRDIISYWDRALFVAKNIRSPVLTDGELALAINPGDKRGQHQLHIHVGKLYREMRDGVETIRKNTRFQQVPITIKGATHKYWVRYLADATNSPADVLANRSPFELVSKEFGEERMPESGIIVARSKDNRGFYVLWIESVFVEDRLDYSGTCRQL
jgi:CDP-diacylglycerol pyrophosphatase